MPGGQSMTTGAHSGDQTFGHLAPGPRTGLSNAGEGRATRGLETGRAAKGLL